MAYKAMAILGTHWRLSVGVSSKKKTNGAMMNHGKCNQSKKKKKSLAEIGGNWCNPSNSLYFLFYFWYDSL